MRRIGIGVAAILVLIAAGCQRQAAAPADEQAAYKAAKEAYLGAESAEDKAKIGEGYLSAFPGGKHAASLADVVIEYRGRELGEPEQAFATVSAALAKASDPGVRFEIAMVLRPLASEVGQPLDLKNVVDSLAATRPLTFGENLDVAEAAVKDASWELAGERSQLALGQATPEAYRADHPGRELTEEQLAARAGKRQQLALAYSGWAAFNLGRRDEATALFERAEEHATFNYLGACTTPLRRFRGEAALARQQWERAAELLEPPALVGADHVAMADLRKAYVGRTGSDEGFDAYLAEVRGRLARKVDDFTLADYEGADHALSGGAHTVTLLAFWFPT